MKLYTDAFMSLLDSPVALLFSHAGRSTRPSGKEMQ